MKRFDSKIIILALTAEAAFAASASAKTVEEILGVVQSQIITPLMSFFGVLALVFFLYGVVEFIAGASNEEKRTIGKKHMIWGLIGLVIIASYNGFIVILRSFFTNISGEY